MPTSNSSPMPNPYVGPRPFETGEHLFGREQEITKLYYVLNADRIVLLYSPSGAGKSSMIQAGLLPRLRDSFDVWRPTRVNLPRPDAVPENVNRYILSAALGFEQSIPEELRRRPEELAGMRLTDCIRTRKRRKTAPKNVLLIFDQFEEILTVDPLAVEAKQEFFDQLGEVLRDPTRWALFAMREDYLAPLDPYVDRVPTHLQNRFRIDLLGRDEAREAIAQPSQEGGRVFEDAAVGKLVNDLATMKVQQPDGSFLDQVGLHVEPLQLQVVCRGLWERLPSEKLSIGVDDVTELGNVTEALSTYYSMEVGKIANGEESVERNIRQWVGDKLITPDGNRGQVLRGPGKTEGLANTLVAKLVDTHLVRAEHRAGAIWYELAHDRLIDPTRADNTQWLDAHLNQTQKRAALWAAQGQPDGLLLLGAYLTEAQRWAKEQKPLTEDEQRFLDASAVAQADADKQRRQQRLILRLGVVAGLIAVVCVFTLWMLYLAYQADQKNDRELASEKARTEKALVVADAAKHTAEQEEANAIGEKKRAVDASVAARNAEAIAVQEKVHAKEESQVALAGKLIAQANNTLTKRPDLLHFTTLLALESMKRGKSVDADHFLRQSLLWLRTPLGHPIKNSATVRSMVFSPDGTVLAAAGEDGTVKVSDLQTGQLRFPPLVNFGPIAGLAFSPKYLAAVSMDGMVRIWNARTGAPVGNPYSLGRAIGNIAACSNSSGLYIANSAVDALTVWKKGDNPSSSPQTTVVDPAAGPSVNDAIFTPDCKHLTSIRAEAMSLWEVDDWRNSRSIPLPAVPNGSSLVFSPDGSYLAAFHEKSVTVWSMKGSMTRAHRGGSQQVAQLKFNDAVTSVAFSLEPGYFATADADGTARLWNLQKASDGEAREVARLTHLSGVSSIVFSPDGKLIASVDSDNTARVWKTAENAEGITTTFENKSGLRVSISTDGQHVVVADPEKILVRRADTSKLEYELRPTGLIKGGRITYADISADGRYVAASIEGTPDFPNSYVRQVWDVKSGKPIPILRTESKNSDPIFMFSANGKYLAIGGSEDTGPNLLVRDLTNGQRIQIPPIKRNVAIDQNCQFFFTPDNKYLAVAGLDGIHLVETANALAWRDRQDIKISGFVERLVVSANGQYIALSTDSDKETTIQVWRIGDPRARAFISQKKLEGVKHNTALALSSDGEYLASADWSGSKLSEDRRVRIWAVATSQVIGEMPLEDRANWFASSADGRLLGVATDGGLKVWDQAQKEEVASTEMAASSILTTFSPDGKYLLTIDGSQNVTSWFWDPKSIVGAVCGKLTSNLTPEQWRQYLPGEPYRKTCPDRPTLANAAQASTWQSRIQRIASIGRQ